MTTQRDWPKSVASTLELKPIRLAAAAYEPKGYVMDFVIVPDVENPTVFESGKTYIIRTSTYNGTSATFRPGCVIKYYGENAAFLALYGSISFPDTLQSPVFTSIHDDTYGERCTGDATYAIPASDGDPTGDLQQDCLNIWYVNYSTDVKNAIFRWGITGIEYSWTGSSANHTIRNCRFEKISNWGVTVNIDPSRSVTFVNSEKYQVPEDKYVSQGSVSGTLTAALFGVEKGFQGITSSWGDAVSVALPDTMGAIGLTEFLEVLNGKVAVFSRTGTRTSELALNDFFQVTGETRNMLDPRVWFDHANQRWITCAADTANDALVVKVSTSSSASLAATNWRRYVISIPAGSDTVDFPTLGSDANGYYISIQVKQSTTHKGFYIQALKKPDVFNTNYTVLPALLSVTPAELNAWVIQPAYSYESSPSGGYAWFIAKWAGAGTNGGQIYYRRLLWNGSTPQWVGSWTGMADPATGYRDYYDIPQGVTFSALESSNGTVNLGLTGSRLMMAVIRSGYLWTCHHIGLDGTDGDFDGGTADRSAVQWFRLQVGTSVLSYSAHGRIYDAASSSPYWYYFPSLNVDSGGNTIFGFSGSKTGEHVGGFFTGRKASGAMMPHPALVQAGRSPKNDDRHGDYSATTIDPSDGSFWTVQQYSHADPNDPVDRPWGTWVMQIKVQ